MDTFLDQFWQVRENDLLPVGELSPIQQEQPTTC
jgi:hypothetical protein